MESTGRLSERMLMLAMVVSTAIVIGLGLWSARAELDGEVARVAEQQAFLAFIVAQDVSSRLSLFEENALLSRASGKAVPASAAQIRSSVLEHLRAVQQKQSMLVLVRTLDHHAFTTADGRIIGSQALEQAFERRQDHVILSRAEGQRLGMKWHRAIAGLATASARDPGTPSLQIAVVTSAAPERERIFASQWRYALIALTAIAVVLWLGRVAIRQLRRELDLAAQLSRSQLERERDAQLARADRYAMLAAMSTGIAHELGTPLGVIVGRLEQLAPLAAAEERTARAVRVIHEQAERISGITRGFLALARGETPVLERASPLSVVEQVQALVRHRLTSAAVSLQASVEADLPEVALDPRLFTQAIINLVINACEASASGDSVSLRVFRQSEHVVFEIADRGVGIKENDAKRATEPFFTTRAQQGGTGLGLAIANEITKQHGGELELRPNTDAGTTRGTIATIRIPIPGAVGGPAMHRENACQA